MVKYLQAFYANEDLVPRIHASMETDPAYDEEPKNVNYSLYPYHSDDRCPEPPSKKRSAGLLWVGDLGYTQPPPAKRQRLLVPDKKLRVPFRKPVSQIQPRRRGVKVDFDKIDFLNPKLPPPRSPEPVPWEVSVGALQPSTWDDPPVERPLTLFKTVQFVPKSIVSNLGASRDYASYENPTTRRQHQILTAKIDCLRAMANQFSRSDEGERMVLMAAMLDKVADEMVKPDPGCCSDDEVCETLSCEVHDDDDDDNAMYGGAYTYVDGSKVPGWHAQNTWLQDGEERFREDIRVNTNWTPEEDELIMGKDKMDVLSVD